MAQRRVGEVGVVGTVMDFVLVAGHRNIGSSSSAAAEHS